MRFVIRHEIKGRMRIHVQQSRMSFRQADLLQYGLERKSFVTSVKVQHKTQDVTICYNGTRERMIETLRRFCYDSVEAPDALFDNSGRELNEQYKERLITKVVLRSVTKALLPYPVRYGFTVIRSLRYIGAGVRTLAKRRIEVPVLDATAIGVSILRGDMETAGSIMFLLGIGEILEEWTHKKSVDDLARSMALNIGMVWMLQNGQEIKVPVTEVASGDEVVVHMGTVIPFDGFVTAGEAMVNQSSMTGESVSVHKLPGGYVYAGTVIEEGELTLRVKEEGGSSRYERIVTMIEESEKLKSRVEGQAEHLADRLVPYSFLGTALTYLLTRNVTKALSVLMVDFSCAMKLAMPISVLSAIREASQHKITVKGGKFLEAMAEADTIVFDKTGTLTLSRPTVVRVIPFDGREPDELLRIAACMEEHFPHSMARAVVEAASARQLEHEEMHSKVEYIVAHGISTTIGGKHAIIGSRHFVFEDEGCVIPDGMQEQYDALPTEYSHLYMAVEKKLAAVICIEDPVRENAASVIRALKNAGIDKVVMMTGDSKRTAAAIAARVQVDEYYSEVLPEEKACFVEKERAAGHKVVMIGDGVNDSPALSAADVGIAISDGAELAREIADITIGADDLYEIVTLKALSVGLMERIRRNYRVIVGFNTGLIAGGVTGLLQPATSALLHNTSTLLIGLESMKNILKD